jgi:hypothetical protein
MRTTTIQTRLNSISDKFLGGRPVSQQAFSKLRSKFNHLPFLAMHEALVKERYSSSNSKTLRKWRGFFLFSIDGSWAHLPRGSGLEKIFGTMGSENSPSAGISTLYDVRNGWIVNTTITHAGMNERIESQKHIEYLFTEHPDIAKSCIFLLDAGYPSKEQFTTMVSKGAKFVMRCPSKHLNVINDAPLGDSIVSVEGDVTIRVIKFYPKGKSKLITIVTNLFDFNKNAIIGLYKERWEIESMYKKLKKTVSLEKFSGQLPNTIYQDFWATIVIFNVCVAYQNEANKVVKKQRRGKNNKYQYQAKFSDLVITLRDRLIVVALFAPPANRSEEIKKITDQIARAVSVKRKHRAVTRNNKRINNTNQNNKSHL